MAVFAMEETNPERGVRLSVHTRAHTHVYFHSHIHPLDSPEIRKSNISIGCIS